MINLTKENIDKAIINKALNIVDLYQKGFIFTNETICTFNSLLIFRSLFNNRCKMLNSAFEKLYYIADSLIPCIPEPGHDTDDGGGGGQDTTKYYTVTVISTPSNANVTINGVSTKNASFPANTRITIVAKLAGYYDKTATISALTRNETVQMVFTDADKIPTPTTYTVTIGTPYPANAKVYVNNTLYPIGSTLTVNPGTVLDVRATADGYNDYHNEFTINSDITIAPVLTQGVTYYTVTIGTPTPPNAVIKVNGNVKNPGDTIVVESGTALVVTAEATGYRLYQENITVNRNMTVTPVLEAIPDTSYVYTVIVRVDGTPINDATIVLTNQSTSESVVGNQISVPANTSVGVVISKTGYQTQSFTKIVTGTATDTIDLVAEDNAVYIQIDGSKQTDVVADRRKVKVYVRVDNYVHAEEIPNNTPYRITPNHSYDFLVVPVDDGGNPDYTNHRIASYMYSAAQTRNLTGTTVKEIVCPRRQNDWMLIIRPAEDDNGNEIEGAEYWDGINHSSQGGFDGPFGFYYRYYNNNTDFGEHVGITCNGYEGVDYDMYNPDHEDLDITPVLTQNSGSYLIVEPSRQSPYDSQPLYEDIAYYEDDVDIVVYPEVTGYRTTDGTPVIGAYLFIDSNLDDDLGNKNVDDIGTTGSVPTGSSTGGPTTPISIVFDNPIASVVGDTSRGNDSWCGPRYFDIVFDVNEENYEPGLEIFATIEDGDSSKQIKFVMPTVPEYEDNEGEGE